MSHWYSETGEPNHFAGKDGAPTSLREARKLGLFPSVTTVQGIVAKPPLNKWITRMAVMRAGVDCSDKNSVGLPIDTNAEWANEMMRQSREETFAKAKLGDEIHDALENWFTEDDAVGKWFPMCLQVDNVIKEHCGFYDWLPEVSFTNTKGGFGGKCDLHSPDWIIDYKTKDFIDDKTRGYADQAEQLAAYAHGLGYPNARLANVFISRQAPPEGEPWAVKWYEHKDSMAWARFEQTCRLWQVTKKYGPYYEQLAA